MHHAPQAHRCALLNRLICLEIVNELLILLSTTPSKLEPNVASGRLEAGGYFFIFLLHSTIEMEAYYNIYPFDQPIAFARYSGEV